MARKKNALTKYFVGPWKDNETAADLWLARYISTVTDDTSETVEEEAFYDGDGTLEQDLTGVQKGYTFEGQMNHEDEAMAFIASLEFEVGDGRKIAFTQERTDGTILHGKATVTEIKVTGGEASEFPEFSCKITWDQRPVKLAGPEGTDTP